MIERIWGLNLGVVGGTGVCKRDWERQKGEGARVNANEWVSELATRAAGRGAGAGCA